MSPFPSLRFDTSFAMASPAVDIAESNGEFKLMPELRGMSEKDVQVSISGDMLPDAVACAMLGGQRDEWAEDLVD